MKINLSQNKNLKLFKLISKTAEDSGLSVYIVGGYVRDLLMKRAAPTDIDFVTEGSGIALAQSVAAAIDPETKGLFSRPMARRCSATKGWSWNL